MNIVMLTGRLTRDPQYSEITNEKGNHHIASFYLVVSKNYGAGVNYIKVTAFGSQADFAKNYLKKGKKVAVSGELLTGSYVDKETGKRIKSAEVTANRIEFADGKTDSFPDSFPEPVPKELADKFTNIPDDFEENLPFH